MQDRQPTQYQITQVTNGGRSRNIETSTQHHQSRRSKKKKQGSHTRAAQWLADRHPATLRQQQHVGHLATRRPLLARELDLSPVPRKMRHARVTPIHECGPKEIEKLRRDSTSCMDISRAISRWHTTTPAHRSTIVMLTWHRRHRTRNAPPRQLHGPVPSKQNTTGSCWPTCNPFSYGNTPPSGHGLMSALVLRRNSTGLKQSPVV